MRSESKIILFAFLLIISGCSLFNKTKETSNIYYSSGIENLILKAIGGDTTANKSLGYFTDLNLPLNSNYNDFSVDSLIISSGKKYFLALISFPNPIYNRFAVYDSTLRLYILDKSLNGYLDDSVFNLNKQKMVRVSERFISKDTLKVHRVSLFLIGDSTARLAFRTFTKLAEPKIEFSQTVTEINVDRIRTEMNSSKESEISNKADVFLFDYSKKKYISSSKIFDNFVINQIRNFDLKPDKPEITDLKSFYASVGIDIDVDTLKTTANTNDRLGFTLTLPDNWRTIKNLTIADYLKKEIVGTKYLNEQIGASISVIMIPPDDSAEMYVKYNLKFQTSGKYKVRYSDKIPMRKDFVQFFEFSCNDNKYILILTASKYTYETYKDIFQSIINSFTIDC
ncbi:MAG: hypothetical protein M1480_09530 [Bacteroidetes bacterium]|nr:hypothetical protein [Bacteroidota bacterium]